MRSIFCVNGTNLVEADKEHQRALGDGNKRICSNLTHHQTEWNFIKSQASYKDGVWECMICSVHAVLSNLLCELGPQTDDEPLHTV